MTRLASQAPAARTASIRTDGGVARWQGAAAAILLALLAALLPSIALAHAAPTCTRVGARQGDTPAHLSVELPGDGTPDSARHAHARAKKPRLTQLHVVSTERPGDVPETLYLLLARAASTSSRDVSRSPFAAQPAPMPGRDPALRLHPGQAPPAR